MTQKPEQPRNLEDRFVDNVSRYPTYFITTLLGGLWIGLKPFVNLYQKSPLAGVLMIVVAILGLIFVHFTLRGMAGETFFPEWILARFAG